uniref:Uncharacterized protein n=1 Tax=viral metagenome TaxID=1070528 RepID=A0A6C0I6H1_9ZZZZ
MPQPLTIVLVDKTGELKDLTVKDYKEDELFKKCGFKKVDGFSKQAEWPVKLNGQKYSIMMFGKDDGKANMENKYDFPPPADNKLLFGCCVLVGQLRDDNGKKSLINLTTDLWTKLYEKLFGGFDDLTATNDDDDDEEDELDAVPKSKKTKSTGYLKDGFVVDDDNEDSNEDNEDYNSSDASDEDSDINKGCDNNDAVDDAMLLEDIGSELSEDSYDYHE